MNLKSYIESINKRYKSGISREHSYRADLQDLIASLAKETEITNEPANVTDCGSPDYVITKEGVPIGFIEAKDVGKNLDSKPYKEQFLRYRKALDNLIITDYLLFKFYENGKLKNEIRIGEIKNNAVSPISKNFDEFTFLIQKFCDFKGQIIKSSKKLAEMMAGKARLLQVIIEKAVLSDKKTEENTSLQQQYVSFKKILISDLTPKDFADIYAQTLTYGMFAALLHDDDPKSFSRRKSAELIPKTNPFLRKLFQYVGGYDIDERIKKTVDNLASVFRAVDIESVLENFGKTTLSEDPVIHFYETFLSEYDPKLRKARGVWYTPSPVVSFIVRSVHELLLSEFELKEGIADISETEIEIKDTGFSEIKKVHKVQVLDPAAGTGAFLAEVIKFIYRQKFESIKGAWSGYVEEHLIPRLNGFELLMASYAMAHLKIDMLLTETGFKPANPKRFNIFLTNSLEKHHPYPDTVFASWLTDEANQANKIKRDIPVMVVLGNPPYSGESANKGDWIKELMKDYKKEPGGTERLEEKNPKWINDDYVKFIRYGQYFIEKNGEGILAFINPHGFLDNPTFRGMRWNLLRTYDKIFILDLHGNAKKKEVSPDGGRDENVFDIQQGVSINLFVKSGKKAKDALARVFHYDLYGLREEKYDFLLKNSVNTVNYAEIKNIEPNYFFVPKNFEAEKVYNLGFSVQSLFEVSSVGVVTSRDTFVIDSDKETLENRIKDFFSLSKENLQNKYRLTENKSWNIEKIQKKAVGFKSSVIKKISYRPFDERYVYYDDNFIERERKEVMRHFLEGENVGLVIGRQGQVVGSMRWNLSFITKNITDLNLYYRGGGMTFPLYLYPDKDKKILGEKERKPNLNMDIVQKIADDLGLEFESMGESGDGDSRERILCVPYFSPLDLLDYVYAVLHGPTYREKYKEFLKIDFPKIPYPKDKKKFFELVGIGAKLRETHLLEREIESFAEYPKEGDNAITRKMTEKSPGFELTDKKNKIGRVWINDTQYFENVPLFAWDFYIGGYQPARKWLKDRNKLGYNEILHYKKIIAALTETEKLMRLIEI